MAAHDEPTPFDHLRAEIAASGSQLHEAAVEQKTLTATEEQKFISPSDRQNTLGSMNDSVAAESAHHANQNKVSPFDKLEAEIAAEKAQAAQQPQQQPEQPDQGIDR